MQHYLTSSSDQESSGERLSLRERERSSLSLDDQARGGQTTRRVDYPLRQDSDDSSSGSFRGRLCGATEPLTAVGLKTGYSVVSIDFPSPASSRKTSTVSSTSKTSSSYQKAPRKSKASLKKAAQQGKDKKLKKTSSVKGVEEITDALCITPLVTPRDYTDDGDQGTNSSSDDLDEDSGEIVHDPRAYSQMAGHTRGVYRFEKVAYPDLYGARGTFDPEPLYNRKFGVQRWVGCNAFLQV